MNNTRFDRAIADLRAMGYVALLWHKDDIQQKAEASGYSLTDDECEDVLDILVEREGTTTGMLGDLVGFFIDEVRDSRNADPE